MEADMNKRSALRSSSPGRVGLAAAVVALLACGGAWAQASSTVELKRATQVQAGPLHTQSVSGGHGEGNGRSNVNVGAASQVQAGALNKQSMDIGNAKDNG